MSFIATNKIHYVPSSGHIYAYIHNPPSYPLKPTLLFLHGFPSTSHDWRHQISYFRSKGYGVLAPDLLGNGGSSKPLNVEDYMGSVMANDIVSILDGEGNIGEIVGIAHDWGTYLLSKYVLRITGWVLHNGDRLYNLKWTQDGYELHILD
jgi:soluble epoxide hydrolase/lipid-phosphate phosphatase